VQNTVYRTAHLKVFTYWMYPLSLFASIFPYSKHKCTYACCLCEVHCVPQEKKLPVQASVSLQCAHVHNNCLIATTITCQCAPSLIPYRHPEMSRRNYHITHRNFPEECGSDLLRGGSLTTRDVTPCRLVNGYQRFEGLYRLCVQLLVV